MSSNHTRVIFPAGFDERAIIEMSSKGWISASVELDDGSQYPVYFSDPVRLKQDLEGEVKAGRYYFTEPGLIVLPEVTVESIQRAVEILYKEGFFAYLCPIKV